MKSNLSLLFLAAAFSSLAACTADDDATPTAAAAPPPAPAPAPAPAPSVNIGTASTGTTAYGVLGTTTARVAFIPSGTGVTPVLLENTGTQTISSSRETVKSEHPAELTPVPQVPLSFTANACAIDSNDLKGICLGYGSAKVAVMDLTTFATSLKVADITVTEFDTGAGTTPNSYSGGQCILCGVAADIGKKRFVVGGAGGFRVYNYGSNTAAAVYDIPVGENFAFLPQSAAHSYIIAPEYEPNGGARKLRVVDLEKALSYVWTKNTDSTADLGTDGSNFVFSEVDAAAIDVNTKMIALSTESTADFLLVDFGQATFDDAAGTFVAPFLVSKPPGSASVQRLTDVAISTSGDILLSHGEGSANIGVTPLPTAAGTAGNFAAGTGTLGMVSLNDAALDRSACGASYSFSGKGDPHGLSLYSGLDNGQKGLIIDRTNTCAAIVNLAGLAAAARDPSNANNFDTTAAGFSALFKFMPL